MGALRQACCPRCRNLAAGPRFGPPDHGEIGRGPVITARVKIWPSPLPRACRTAGAASPRPLPEHSGGSGRTPCRVKHKAGRQEGTLHVEKDIKRWSRPDPMRSLHGTDHAMRVGRAGRVRHAGLGCKSRVATLLANDGRVGRGSDVIVTLLEDGLMQSSMRAHVLVADKAQGQDHKRHKKPLQGEPSAAPGLQAAQVSIPGHLTPSDTGHHRDTKGQAWD